MNWFAMLTLYMVVSLFSFCQSSKKIINAREVQRVEAVLSSDSMQGRKAGTPGIKLAEDFIAGEFKKIGLQTLNNASGYKQEFALIKPNQISIDGTVNGVAINEQNVVVFTSANTLQVNSRSGYKKVHIKPGANLLREAQQLLQSNENAIVVVDSSFSKNFPMLNRLKRTSFKNSHNILFLLTQTDPADFQISVSHEFEEQQMANIVGVLPGKSKKEEFVIFSGHHDHLGIGKPVNGDSIYNGANDDAAGTTAVIMLAKYFKALANNERTLVFTTFTAEEIGGYGSQYFSRQISPGKVVAMFNIEMIGTESKWGRNSAYITGFDKTDMGAILGKNLEGSNFKFYPDPYTDQQLFFRSDNATLARLGVPAHTISTSKMDNEPNYHKVTDEIQTLDIKNMAEIIKAIALSAGSIINGKDTPTRVNTSDLN